MNRLDDLKRSVADMSDEELKALVQDIRRDRKVSKRVKRTVPKQKRVAAKQGLATLLQGMSKEDKLALLQQMGVKV
jgi:hypothetical protein